MDGWGARPLRWLSVLVKYWSCMIQYCWAKDSLSEHCTRKLKAFLCGHVSTAIKLEDCFSVVPLEALRPSNFEGKMQNHKAAPVLNIRLSSHVLNFFQMCQKIQSGMWLQMNRETLWVFFICIVSDVLARAFPATLRERWKNVREEALEVQSRLSSVGCLSFHPKQVKLCPHAWPCQMSNDLCLLQQTLPAKCGWIKWWCHLVFPPNYPRVRAFRAVRYADAVFKICVLSNWSFLKQFACWQTRKWLLLSRIKSHTGKGTADHMECLDKPQTYMLSQNRTRVFAGCVYWFCNNPG